MRSWLDATWFVPMRAVRPYLVLKGTLLLLAFDMWITRIPHAGRYGAGPFNVAHFAVLDAVQPQLSPGIYLGLCVLIGVLAMAGAIVSRPPRWLLGLIFVLYTWSWAMSMFDSYQHHYLLSIALLAFVFFPRLDADQALTVAPLSAAPTEAKPERKPTKSKKRKKKRAAEKVARAPEPAPRGIAPSPWTSAYAYVALALSFAIVYVYTAYSKTDPAWLDGSAFKHVLHLDPEGHPLPHHPDLIAPVRELLAGFGVAGERFWWLMGHSVVLVQIVCAAGYVLAPFRDVMQSRALRAFSYVALFTALSFHFGAEYLSLKIGWFSWYMVGYALVYMMPGELLVAFCRLMIPVRGHARNELLLARVGLSLGVTFLGLAGGVWARGVLAQMFGSGLNVPLVVLGVAMLMITPVRWLAHAVDTDTRASRVLALVVTSSAVVVLLLACALVDLPGAVAGGGIVAVAIVAVVITQLVRTEDARVAHPYGVAAGLAALSLFLSVALTEARWDFYRNLGGDTLRRHDYAASIDAYEHANEYAPAGQNRNDRLRRARRAYERERARLERAGAQ